MAGRVHVELAENVVDASLTPAGTPLSM